MTCGHAVTATNSPSPNPVVHGNDQVRITRPGALCIESRCLRRMAWMTVVVADDVHVRAVRLALDADVIAWIDLIAVSCALDDDVAGSLGLGHKTVATRPDHDPAYLVRVALRAVGADRIHGIARDLHV